MLPCASCGRPLAAGASFCTACGAFAPAPVGAAAVAPVPASGPAPAGPTGRRQEPWVVPVLALVTFGIYQFVWLWRVTREVDAWQGKGAHAHAAARKAVLLAVVGSLAFLVVLVAFVVVAGSAADPQAEAPPEDPFAELSASQVTGLAAAFAGSLVVLLVSVVYTYVGLWRVWTALGTDAARRGTKPLSPALLLALMLVPYVNLVGTFYALWRTQKELNAAWAATPPQIVASPS